jgi:hypothetical protein
MNDFRKANTGGRRNEKPLTEEQKKQAEDYAVSLGMPVERIKYSSYSDTGYIPGYIDTLVIGTDVLPIGQRAKTPNDNISLKGTVAHEIIGHRESILKGRGQSEKVLDEAQASIRAARFAPDLDMLERRDLVRDAIHRLNEAGLSLRHVKDKLFISER